jgi:hypothetical protein
LSYKDWLIMKDLNEIFLNGRIFHSNDFDFQEFPESQNHLDVFYIFLL